MKRAMDILFKALWLIAMAVAIIRLVLNDRHPLDPVLHTAAFVLLIVLYVLPMIRKRMERKNQESEASE